MTSTTLPTLFDSPRFNGSDYVPSRDDPRLTGQLARIWAVVRDHRWRTLHEIAIAADAPEASVSAQLRHLRKSRFGGNVVAKRHRGEPRFGIYEYSVNPIGEQQ